MLYQSVHAPRTEEHRWKMTSHLMGAVILVFDARAMEPDQILCGLPFAPDLTQCRGFCACDSGGWIDTLLETYGYTIH